MCVLFPCFIVCDLTYRFYLNPSASGDSIHSTSQQATATGSTENKVGAAMDTLTPGLISFPESEDPGEAPASQTATHKRSVHKKCLSQKNTFNILSPSLLPFILHLIWCLLFSKLKG